MWNHARELAGHGHAVSLIGFGAPPEEVAGVQVSALRDWKHAPTAASRGIFLLWSGVRMTLLFSTLMARLIRLRPGSILVQNPPSFPTLAASWIAAKAVGARLIVDWHNYGFTILGLRLGRSHFMVKLARWYEFAAGRRADGHLCVSEAMREDLKKRAGIEARTLYDRPVAAPRAEKRGVGMVVVCPLGWTEDDDVALLLDGLAMIQAASPMEIYLTGDGPGRKTWKGRIEGFSRPGIVIRSGDLPEAEYRSLLRRATVGVSVHRSSSGLDLAMKVVDLFAACVPVAALDYGGTLREQIEDGVTGFLFRDAAELAGLFEQAQGRPAVLDFMRRAIEIRATETWGEAWQREAGDLFGER
jgi:beta-1,4-mannosyltransferase